VLPVEVAVLVVAPVESQPGLGLSVVGTGINMPPVVLAEAPPVPPPPVVLPPETPVVVPPETPPPVYVPPVLPPRRDRN
jgi:hypothetical protein